MKRKANSITCVMSSHFQSMLGLLTKSEPIQTAMMVSTLMRTAARKVPSQVSR